MSQLNKLAAPIVLAAATAAAALPDGTGDQLKNAVAGYVGERVLPEMLPDAIIQEGVAGFFDRYRSVAPFTLPGEIRNNFGGMSYSARAALYQNELCAGQSEEQCSNINYAGQSGRPEAYGVSKPVADAFQLGRKLINNIAREFVRDPKRLKALYEAKKEVIIASIEFELAEPENNVKREDFLLWLENSEKAFRQFMEDPELLTAYQNYLNAEEMQSIAQEDKDTFLSEKCGDLHVSSYGGTRLECRSSDYKTRGIVDVPELTLLDDRTSVAYDIKDDTEAALRKISPDFEATLFAGRRAKEANPEVLETYADILFDLGASLQVQ